MGFGLNRHFFKCLALFSTPRRKPSMKPAPVTSVPSALAFLATAIEPALADRTWSTQKMEGAPCFRAFFVRRGEGVLHVHDGAPLNVIAPVLVWLPFSSRAEFRLAAGGEGATFLVGAHLVARLIAESPMGAQWRGLVERPVLATEANLGARLAEIESVFVGLVRETRTPEPGAPAMIQLYIGLLLTHLWRSCKPAVDTDAFDAGAPTAQRFRQLVELHYRDNLRIDDFARRMGVTRAHLHHACLRALGRPPQQFIHERLIAEARMRLRESSQSIEQIAYSLGFRDAAYFNRFFRRASEISPGAYRKASRVALPREATSFSSWP
jgi:AraC family transcriptional activator of pobA